MALKEDVKKNFGDNVMLTANAVIDKSLITIPVSRALNVVLNGALSQKDRSLFYRSTKMW